jgi:hypothetical protein
MDARWELTDYVLQLAGTVPMELARALDEA